MSRGELSIGTIRPRLPVHGEHRDNSPRNIVHDHFYIKYMLVLQKYIDNSTGLGQFSCEVATETILQGA